MTRNRLVIAILITAILIVATAGILHSDHGYAAASFVWGKLRGGYTVEDRVRMHGHAVEQRLKPRFASAALPYPPRRLAYVAFKDTAELQVYARESDSDTWRHVLTYPIRGMSGTLGPKLREGDLQVPEGVYRAELLNANSRFHLSIRLDYPNAFDLTQAAIDGRARPGSDIMIHGTSSSVGCLAMGNQAAEDLFVLAALAGKEQVDIVIAPTDFRHRPVRIPEASPAWLPGLYAQIEDALGRFPSAR